METVLPKGGQPPSYPPLVDPVLDDGATGNNITLIEEEWR